MRRTQCTSAWMLALLIGGCSGSVEGLPSAGQVDSTTPSGGSSGGAATTTATAAGSGASGASSSDGSASTSSASSTGGDATTDETSSGVVSASTGDGTTGPSEGSSSTGDGTALPALLPASYTGSGGAYQFGYMSPAALEITGAPEDTDWSIWATLYDTVTLRLYCMRSGTLDTLYPFAFDELSGDFVYGLDAPETIPIVGAPIGADLTKIAMLHGDGVMRLYALSDAEPLMVHHFGYDAVDQQFEYGYGSLTTIDVTGFPAGTATSGFGMLHGSGYRLYFYLDADENALAQASLNTTTGDFEYGHNSVTPIDIVSIPAGADTSDFSMAHDANYHLYLMRPPGG